MQSNPSRKGKGNQSQIRGWSIARQERPEKRSGAAACPTRFPSLRVSNAPSFLNKDEFAHVVRNTPLAAIDLIVRDPDRCVLVGLRTHKPAKGKWFVRGGVVRKYERLADAFARIVKAEVGLDASIADAKFVGVYEHLYDNNVFGEEGCRADARTQPRLPAADYEGSAAQLLSLDDPNRVHCLRFIRTRAYFL